MKKYIITAILLFILITTIGAQVDKKTFNYAFKGTDTLRLDKYEDLSVKGQKPCIIFMFGGGFVGGSRNEKSNVAYLEKLAQNGYVAIGIDYRLGLKDVPGRMKQGEKIGAKEIITLMDSSINIAVEDLYDATNFVIENAKSWSVDKDIIVANGSSAGAISVLQAEYMICSNHNLAKRLPEGFNYAGIIAFAGAIFSTNGNLKWIKNPAPIMFFHGDADSNVPYNKLKLFKLGFFGSKNLSDQLNKMQTPYYFYDVENAAHEIAGSPMLRNMGEINTFMDKFVISKEKMIIHTKVTQIGKPEMKKKFGIKEYIKSNF